MSDMVAVVGETFEIKEQLSAMGGRWDKLAECWFVPSEKHAEAQRMADDETRRIRPLRWRSYVNSLAWVKGSLAECCYYAALRGGSLGIPACDIEAECAARIAAAGAPVKMERIKRDVRRGIEASGGSDVEVATVAGWKKKSAPEQPITPKPKFNEAALKTFAGEWARRATAVFLADRSPVDVMGCSADGFLRALYQPGETVVVCDVFESQGSWMWSHEKGFEASKIDFRKWAGEDALRENAPPLAMDARAFDGSGPAGIWYLCNPVDGVFHKLGEQDDKGREKWSRRSKEAVTSWRYFVLESDEADLRDWVGAIVKLPLPIAAIYTSGGKSIHVLVRVNAESKADFDRVREMAIQTFVVLGADRGAMSAVRLTRLPFCWRLADKEGNAYPQPRPQKLLFLDPSAGDTEIAKRPRLRDCIVTAMSAPSYAAGMEILNRLGTGSQIEEAKHSLAAKFE
jgi:hypothetical protein